jgi:hypothetical protein
MAVHWASTPDRASTLTRVRFPSSAPIQRETMAKKIYHIPLQKFHTFIKEHKSKLHKLFKNTQQLEYAKRFGKMRYDEQIEAYILFFKIDKEIHSALKTIDYLSSTLFFETLTTKLNFSQFELPASTITKRELFYALCHYTHQYDNALLENFLHQYFLHEHASLTANTQISINYKEIATALLKSQNLTLKESFGEDEKSSFYKVHIEGKEIINLKGKSIKTLRKKAYKLLLTQLLDGDINNETDNKIQQAHDMLSQI